MAEKQLEANLALALENVKTAADEILLPPHLQMPPVSDGVVELERAGFQRLLAYCNNAEPAIQRAGLNLKPGIVETDYRTKPVKTEALFNWAHEVKDIARKLMYYANVAANNNDREIISKKEVNEAVCRLKGLDYKEVGPLYKRVEKKYVSHSYYGSWFYGCHPPVGNNCGCRLRHVKAVTKTFRCTACGNLHHIDCGTDETKTICTTCRREEREGRERGERERRERGEREGIATRTIYLLKTRNRPMVELDYSKEKARKK